jgi:hypothetical protein
MTCGRLRHTHLQSPGLASEMECMGLGWKTPISAVGLRLGRSLNNGPRSPAPLGADSTLPALSIFDPLFCRLTFTSRSVSRCEAYLVSPPLPVESLMKTRSHSATYSVGPVVDMGIG